MTSRSSDSARQSGDATPEAAAPLEAPPAPSPRRPSPRGGPPAEVEQVGAGMRVRQTKLYLDATRVTELCFVSHAHSDHLARHRRIVATAQTLQLAAHRLGTLPATLPVPYGQSFQLEDLTLELLPAGHILGSAQLRITRKGRRLVYTGDLNPVPGLTATPAEVGTCDTLVIESTFGHPRYRFPPREETYAAMRDFAVRALDDGATPVFLGYPLGKSQEGIRAILDARLPVAAAPPISDICALYERCGCPLPHRRFDGELRPDEVVFHPIGAALEPLRQQRPIRTAVLSGWALERGARWRFGTDEAFPLSDHADFEGLLGYVRASGASRVFTVHGFAKELAACLRDRGFDARPLQAPRQLELF